MRSPEKKVCNRLFLSFFFCDVGVPLGVPPCKLLFVSIGMSIKLIRQLAYEYEIGRIPLSECLFEASCEGDLEMDAPRIAIFVRKQDVAAVSSAPTRRYGDSTL